MGALTTQDRFWAKVDVQGPGECWNWIAATRKENGYGRFHCPEEDRMVQSTYYLIKYILELDPKEVRRHTCDNPACCNPAHILVGSQADNLEDMRDRGRHWNQKKDRCKRGHSRWSVQIKKNGQKRRRCLDCRSIYG